MPASLHEMVLGGTLAAFRDLQSLHKMEDTDLAALADLATQGLPYFIQYDLSDVQNIPNLRVWQRHFWNEAWRRWTPPQWDQPRTQQRLLQHACTGAGKSDIIAMAPFAGARDRCLVVVPFPSLAILHGLTIAFGASQDDGADEHALPTLRSRGLLSSQKPLPKDLLLPGITKEHVIPGILRSQIVLTTAKTLKNRILQLRACVHLHFPKSRKTHRHFLFFDILNVPQDIFRHFILNGPKDIFCGVENVPRILGTFSVAQKMSPESWGHFPRPRKCPPKAWGHIPRPWKCSHMSSQPATRSSNQPTSQLASQQPATQQIESDGNFKF